VNELTDADAPPVDDAPQEQYDLEAEQSVLGGMMLSTRAVEDVMDVIVPSDLYQPKHELIARAIGALYGRNEPTDVIAVAEELARTGKLRQAGEASYLHELTSLVPTAANAGYYADIVKRMAVLRRLRAAGVRITAMGSASEGEIDALVEQARVELEQVVTGRRAKLRMIGDGFDDLVDALQSTPEYLPTPWESLDKLIGGFAPGSLIIAAARPGAGKSIFALQAAAKLAHEGMVAFSSLEMTEQELQKRLLAQYGSVHMSQLRNHNLGMDDWKRVAEARTAVQAAPIFVDETASANLAHIRSHARAVARRGKLVLVVVDYLQLVAGEGQSRQEVVGTVARGLKQLAKDLNVPVLAAAQLRRAGERRGKNTLPGLDDLRESGDIEAAADVVLLLDRDKDRAPNDLTVVVAKNRHGEQGKFTLLWQAQFARLRDKRWSPLGLFDEGDM
jgi:replicative DNA helicase